MKKKPTRLQKAQRDSYAGTQSLDAKREFSMDLLKHYIRREFWLKRIIRLLRARDIKQVKYLTLCAKESIDIRLLRKNNLLPLSTRAPFVFCEMEEDVCKFLKEESIKDGQGFQGKIEDLCTDTSNKQYGNFWSEFPFDVINLDFWGDIHTLGDYENNTYNAMQAILQKQLFLRRPYELWITFRAKQDRLHNVIIKEYTKILQNNYTENKKFRDIYDRTPGLKGKEIRHLDDEQIATLGFLKWLLYAAKMANSTIDDMQVLSYTREGKEGNDYEILNVLLRVKPYEKVEIPSPCSDAVDHCQSEYEKNVKYCFEEKIDVNKKYKALTKEEIQPIKAELDEFKKTYDEERKISFA